MSMKLRYTGMTRPVDELGRIVLPKELRDSMDIREKDRMEVWMSEDGMVLKKTSVRCKVCGEPAEEMLEVDGCVICRSCARRIADRLRRGE